MPGKRAITRCAEPTARSWAPARSSRRRTLDQGFGKEGTTLPSFGTSGRASSIALQGDKLVAIGDGSTEGFLIARYNPNGALDLTFDQDGVILAPLGREGVSASAVAPLDDGQLIVVGRGKQELAVARFQDNGAFLPWFGDEGRLFLPIASVADSVSGRRHNCCVPFGEEEASGWSTNRPRCGKGGSLTMSDGRDLRLDTP